jgi:uncharacterized protein YceH (UPF0502 family)
MDRQPPLVRVLPRQPGTKESRYMHLFSGDVAADYVPPTTAPARPSGEELGSRVASLEAEVSSLRDEIDALRRELAEFKQQF